MNFKNRDGFVKRNRVNEQIRLSPLMVIDENGAKLGVIPNHEALAKAREKGLDLVEVSPEARPPVCRIMDYSKFRYEQSIKNKKNKKNTNKIKEMCFRPSTGDHDILTKVTAIKRFLEEGHLVQIKVKFKQRENAHKDLGFGIIEKIMSHVSEIAQFQTNPKLTGPNIFCVLQPK